MGYYVAMLYEQPGRAVQLSQVVEADSPEDALEKAYPDLRVLEAEAHVYEVAGPAHVFDLVHHIEWKRGE